MALISSPFISSRWFVEYLIHRRNATNTPSHWCNSQRGQPLLPIHTAHLAATQIPRSEMPAELALIVKIGSSNRKNFARCDMKV